MWDLVVYIPPDPFHYSSFYPKTCAPLALYCYSPSNEITVTAVSKIAWWGTGLMAEEEILGREMPTRENHGILVRVMLGVPERERQRERECRTVPGRQNAGGQRKKYRDARDILKKETNGIL